MSRQDLLLSASNVQDYLAEHGLWPRGKPLYIRELGGGVSNIALLVEGKAPGGEEIRWVVKQSLEKLRAQDDWRSEGSRIFLEAEVITVLVEIDSNLFFKPHSKMLRSPHAYAHWRGNPLVSTSSNLVHRFDCDDRVAASAGWAGGKLKTKHLPEL